jgi:hypothetical protein
MTKHRSYEPLRGSRVSYSSHRGLADYMRVGSPSETLHPSGRWQQLAGCVILRLSAGAVMTAIGTTRSHSSIFRYFRNQEDRQPGEQARGPPAVWALLSRAAPRQKQQGRQRRQRLRAAAPGRAAERSGAWPRRLARRASERGARACRRAHGREGEGRARQVCRLLLARGRAVRRCGGAAGRSRWAMLTMTSSCRGMS